MPAKTPMYLKTPTPKHGKKLKLRDVLSSERISSPLENLHHSAHVGPQGDSDMFGDVDFLQGKLYMLPTLAHPSTHSMDRHVNDMFETQGIQTRYNPQYCTNHSSGLKSMFSVPAFMTPEQPPPKPPRLHLEENSNSLQQNHHNHQQLPMTVCANGVGLYREPYHDLTLSASIPILRHLNPSVGSFSEASSEDSMSECCVPPDPTQGLSLDSDAGLSNEDLQSVQSESPAFSPTISRSESFAGLDLDLGPSILEDVLRIMDRYMNVKDRCDL